MFTCLHCGRPYAVARDVALREWGRRGWIEQAAAALRCGACRKLGMAAALAPAKARLGSPSALDRLTAAITAIKPSRQIE